MLKYPIMWAGIAATEGSGYRLDDWWIPGCSDRDFSLPLHKASSQAVPASVHNRLGPLILIIRVCGIPLPL